MKALRIREWQERYEVNDKGHAARLGAPASKFRQRKLAFVRLKVNGRAKGAGYRRLEAAAGTATALEAAMCLWPKLLEIAADGPPEQRGWILNEEGQPASVRDLQFFTGFRLTTIRTALQVLSHPKVQWIIKAESSEIPGHSGNPREIPDTYVTKPNRTKPNRTKPKGARENPGNAAGGSAAGSDSRSGSEDFSEDHSGSGFVAKGKPNVQAVGQALALHLGLGSRTAERGSRREKQLKADATCLLIMAAHIVDGHVGQDVRAARDACYAKAKEFKASRPRKPIAMFEKWFKEQLAKEGHKWR
jgi:hypothetical protein